MKKTILLLIAALLFSSCSVMNIQKRNLIKDGGEIEQIIEIDHYSVWLGGYDGKLILKKAETESYIFIYTNKLGDKYWNIIRNPDEAKVFPDYMYLKIGKRKKQLDNMGNIAIDGWTDKEYVVSIYDNVSSDKLYTFGDDERIIVYSVPDKNITKY